MHDQNSVVAVEELPQESPREQVERELTSLVAELLEEVKTLARVARIQQRRLYRLEVANARKAVR